MYHLQLYKIPEFFDLLRNSILGLIFVIIAIILIYSALKIFKSNLEDPNPTSSSTQIFYDGIYRYTRNPMYLGLILFQIGLGMILSMTHITFFAFLTYLVYRYGVIEKEEVYLSRKFGEPYIKSLRLDDKITEIFSTKEIIPSAGQGIIALQCRSDDKEVISILDKVNHIETHQRAHAERNVLKILEGDCETAVGVYSVIEGNELTLEAELFSLDGSQRCYQKKISKIENAKELGKELGEILKKQSNNSYRK